MAILRLANNPVTGYVVIDDDYNVVYTGTGWGMNEALKDAFGAKVDIKRLKENANVFISVTSFSISDWIAFRKQVDKHWLVKTRQKQTS